MRLITGLISSLLVLASPAIGREYQQLSGTAPDGTRFYEDSLVIRASPKQLWNAFTDANAYRRWAAPVSSVDFRIGGTIEASYDPDGHLGDPQNIKNEFIAYIPGRLLVFRNVQAPSRLPGREVYGDTIKTLEFTPLDATHTRVTVSGVGFGKGASSDQLYAFFSAGDGEMLTTLKRAMEASGR
jgi:uncharacterized protein YndB with AHSA1/START domain